jgi:hypothetical protein
MQHYITTFDSNPRKNLFGPTDITNDKGFLSTSLLTLH